jgi:agmatine deiminase
VRDRAGIRERVVVDWDYNAWGGKYPPYDLDDAVPRHVAALRGLPLYSPGMILEGGSIEVNGAGTLLTTEACLLNPNRNPKLNREQIEQQLRDYLGVRHILWLGDGIVGDDTDGHIDDIARFTDSQTVVTVVEEDPTDARPAMPISTSPTVACWCRPTGMPMTQGLSRCSVRCFPGGRSSGSIRRS